MYEKLHGLITKLDIFAYFGYYVGISRKTIASYFEETGSLFHCNSFFMHVNKRLFISEGGLKSYG